MPEPRDSFGRCTSQADFLDRFYERFLRSHASIAPRFVKTDMAAQKALLRQGLALLLMWAEGRKTGESALLRIARTHGPGGAVDVPPETYRYWKQSLLQTVREMDPQFSPEVEAAWRDALDRGIHFITSHYDAGRG